MGDAENVLPSSKKRAALREISRDDPGLDDEEDTSEQEAGTFKRASEEVLATRRIVKVRRPQTTSAPSSNPFARIRLVSNERSSEKAPLDDVDGKTKSSEEKEKGKDEDNKQSESHVNENEAEAATDKNNTAVEVEKSNIASEATEPVADNEPAIAEDKTGSVDKKDDEPAVGEDQPESDDKKDDEPAVGEDQTANDDKKDDEPAVGEGKTENDDKKDDEPAVGEDETENDDKKDESTDDVDPNAESSRLSSFQQLSSSQNAFTNLSGTGFSTSTFSFGSIAKDGSGTGPGSLFGSKSDQPFGLGLSNNGNSSLFGTPGAPIVSKSEGSSFPSMHEVAVETGEENEEVVFNADSVLFEFMDGGWKERGKGELKINVSTTGTEKARLLMRARGNYRLILNANLYPDMKLTNMEKKGITFACVNSTGEGTGGFSTFALKFKDGSIVEKFCTVVTEHKGKTPAAPAVLKTPENSPKASDE
uniref:nuclear pore complex protein NUP50A-like isoform X3 n=1 Tax=Ziziphus jujuba TaxID=326968 RepID=A0A6P3Z625_ZIZJJ